MIGAQQELGASRRPGEDLDLVSDLNIGIDLPRVTQRDTRRSLIDRQSLYDGLNSLLTAGPSRWDIALAKIATLRVVGRDKWGEKAGEYDQSQKENG